MNYTEQRARSTSEVLRLINELKNEIGVTRLADITELDNINIPVYCSYRPKAYLLQANSGKGYTHEAAKCSAMMEALEYSEFERFSEDKVVEYASYNQLKDKKILTYDNLNVQTTPFYSNDTNLYWIELNNISTEETYLCPADMVYITNKSYIASNTNGLASGNNNEESLLHSMYEIIERDAYAQLLTKGKLDIRKKCKRINMETINSSIITNMTEKINNANNLIYLMHLPSSINVYSFWCIILDNFSINPVGSFNIGLGCHADPEIAAIRAITEAAQSRLVYIHGNREDIRHKLVFNKENGIPDNVYPFFESLNEHSFNELCGKESPCLKSTIKQSNKQIIAELKSAGYEDIYTHILRKEEKTFSVVKTIIPGMKCESKLL
ncbi:YcaO-like family protein [Synechococcus sp. AH-603-L18]|nr:YcaO-like family protein [Synechococcus sp. AH-603-L18]MDB4338314.1 YcaO-like family protein [Synechococcus sp. AH-603-L18]